MVNIVVDDKNDRPGDECTLRSVWRRVFLSGVIDHHHHHHRHHRHHHHDASCIMHHASCVMCHASYIISHVSCVMCHLSCVMCEMCNFCVIWYFVSFDILCHLTLCVIWHFVSFDILCHLTFRAIWNFVSFDISCDLIHHCQSHQSIYVQVVVKDRCVFKKWAYSHRAVSRKELLRS